MFRTTSTIAAAAAIALSGGLLATTAPHADASVTSGLAKGRAIAQVSVRTAPTTQGQQVGVLYKGNPTTITCKVHGQRVGGNDIWYQLADESGPVYVSARYVTNIGAAPHWCHGNATTALKAPAAVRVKQAPTSQSPTVRTLAKGTRATAVCRVDLLQPKGGRQGWYYLGDGRWVTVSGILANHATAPCH